MSYLGNTSFSALNQKVLTRDLFSFVSTGAVMKVLSQKHICRGLKRRLILLLFWKSFMLWAIKVAQTAHKPGTCTFVFASQKIDTSAQHGLVLMKWIHLKQWWRNAINWSGLLPNICFPSHVGSVMSPVSPNKSLEKLQLSVCFFTAACLMAESPHLCPELSGDVEWIYKHKTLSQGCFVIKAYLL